MSDSQFPKMLYRAKRMFLNPDDISAAIASRELQQQIVQNPVEEALAVEEGWGPLQELVDQPVAEVEAKKYVAAKRRGGNDGDGTSV